MTPCPCGTVGDSGPFKLKRCRGRTPPVNQDDLEAALMREAVLPLLPEMAGRQTIEPAGLDS
jgi:hypothetical protein